ncbi:alpha/beta fold hydrolase [Streptomyces sp. NPDC052079]|uniref:alpha/beta fold hydrolase n=1 Tax=Streptomyces sp. NPDC052079 TaxID=3155526 RepID=UPI00343A7083
METSITTRDGLRLWKETFGSRRDPAVLLVMGGAAPGIVWPDELCRRLAAHGYFVVRYDHRDTGRSDKSPGEYDLSAPASDAAEVITGLGPGATQVVGQSFGGMVAQLLALERRELVRSLVLLSSSPDANGDVRRPPRTGLPGPRRPMRERVARLTQVLVEPVMPFDYAYWVDLVRRVSARGSDPETSGRHLTALDRTPPLTGRLPALDLPTLVVHGEQDSVFPPEHGEELRRVIPRARLWRMAGMGHIFPPYWSSTMCALIVDHLRRSRSDR